MIIQNCIFCTKPDFFQMIKWKVYVEVRTKIQAKIMTFLPTSDISKVANKSQSSPVQAGLQQQAFEMNKIFFDVTGRSEWSTISGMIDRHLSMVWPQQLWINLLWKKSVIGGSTHELLVPAHLGTSSDLKQSWTKIQLTTDMGQIFEWRLILNIQYKT